MNWPEHPVFPNYGYTITRFNLDGLVAERAEELGAVLLGGVEALALLEATEASGGGLHGAAAVLVKDKDSDEAARFEDGISSSATVKTRARSRVGHRAQQVLADGYGASRVLHE